MDTLFSALRSSADALNVFQRALTVSQNNVVNASTPGYVKQIQDLQALPFDPGQGLAGGVAAGPVESARDLFAEQSVQQQVSSLGTWEEQVNTLTPLQGSFDITGQNGIPGALNQLYQSFSAWSNSPNDATARQAVLNQAQSVALAFQQQSSALTQASSNADVQLGNLVDQVNSLAGQLRQDNIALQNGRGQDAGLEADVYNTLEQLSEIAPVSALRQPDGSFTVMLAGQTPLVVGATQYSISSRIAVPDTPAPANPSGPPSASVRDASGKDITATLTQGRLGGLLQVRNGILAQLRGDSSQPGQLNQLAQAVADRINTLLTSGNISGSQPGVPLFTYNAGNPASAAQSLSVNSDITPGQLAAIDPGPPQVSNGIALKLANLATSQDPADQINNTSYAQFFGNMAATLGSTIAMAQNNQSTQQSLVTQSRDLRQQTSGVSLDEEAIHVLEFQRSYQAASKMVTDIDQLTQTLVNMVQ